MTAARPISKFTGTGAWSPQNQYVERLMDNSAYTSAHPDDTLVLAGPARLTSVNPTNKLQPIGMVQNLSVMQSKPTTPIMGIGSGRCSFLSGKAQTQWNMSRLFVNGPNLLRALYNQAASANITFSTFDDPAASAGSANANMVMNLDSELFLIPFGLGFLFRDKAYGAIGAFYLELCAISSWQVGMAAGQSFVAEQVTGLADRLLPMPMTHVTMKPDVPSASNMDTAMPLVDGTPAPSGGATPT